jgi:hypothetical protein
MVSIEAFSGIIVALIFSSFLIGACIISHIEIYGSNRRPKLRVILFIISTVAALAVTGLSVLYYYGVNEYIDIAENDNGVILSKKTSCDIVELYTVFDSGYNKINYIAWYTYRNSTRYYYHGICNGQVNCWPSVGDLINCWPVVEDSVITAYVINPPLIDVGYYKKHRKWAIAQLIISVLISFNIIVYLMVIIDKQSRISQIEGEHNPNLDLVNLGGIPVHNRQFMELEGVQVNEHVVGSVSDLSSQSGHLRRL